MSDLRTASQSSLLSPKKDGVLLLGAYTTYLTQLITNLSLTKNPSWNLLIGQIMMFGALLAMREYKKKSSDCCDIGSNTEPNIDESPKCNISKKGLEQRASPIMAEDEWVQVNIQRPEPIPKGNSPLSPIPPGRPF